MSEPIIKVEHLGKKYNIGEKQSYYSLRDTIAGLFSIKKKKNQDEFWALKDLNFSVKRGENVGIIGRNGAGKSTLLKVLSQITPPTKGRITMRGRVASLLEVGTGFNPELTGRENVFLNGAILGMTRQEVKRKFDQIVSFSEIEKFLDTPVKRYSSGMYVRLAFAVAAHLEPEILIVDEVLAVGDAQFQEKCLGKMDEVSRKEGRTVLFVSHNMSAVKSLCQRTILLDKGTIICNGETSKVVEKYSNLDSHRRTNEVVFDIDEDQKMQIAKVSLRKNKNKIHTVDSELIFDFELITRKIVGQSYVSIDIFNNYGETIYWTSDIGSERFKNPKLGTTKLICKCPKYLLTSGNYSAHFAIVSLIEGVTFHYPDKKIFFKVEMENDFLLSIQGIKQPGVTAVKSDWELK